MREARAPRWGVGIAGTGAILIGGFWLVAWWAGYAAGWSAAQTTITMKTNMALGLVLAGMALILLGLCPQNRGCRWAGLALATLILLAGGLTLSEHLIGWDLGIDQLLAKEPPGALATNAPNRMGLPGSSSHALLGIALLLLGMGRHGGRERRVVPYVGLTVILVNLIPAVGFLYGVDLFFDRPAIGIAWPTVVAMIGLGVGLVLVCPESGPMVLLLREDAGGRLLRSMLPVALLLPLGLGFLRVLGQRRGLYDATMGAALFALVMMLIFALVLWRSAGRMSRADQQQKQADQALRASEDRLNQAVRVASLGIFEQDHRSGAIYCSPTLRRIWGWSEEAPVTLAAILGQVPPHERETLEALIQTAHDPQGDGLYVVDHHMVRPDGGIRWVSVQSQTFFEGEGAARRAVRTVGATLDITERKQMEAALRDSEWFFRQMLESIPGMVFTTRPDGYCDYQSQQWVEFTGVPMSEHMGDGWNKLLFPEDRPRAFAAWRDAVEGRAPYDVEYRVRRHDGEYEWFKVRGRPIHDTAGQIVRWFGVATSIEASKRNEEALAAAKVSAEQASKAKDQFIAVLSHELRNPLNPVLATVSMLQKDSRFDADTRDQLEVIHRNVDLEARLIDDLLDVTRIERGKIELDRRPIDLTTIIHRAAEVCLPDIEARRLEFGIDLGPAPYWVSADAARLQQVFWNLIKNAVKFTPEGGCVGVRCRRTDGHVVAEVSDSGEGIDPEVLPRLFSAFEQGGRPITRQFGGLGLGLTISKAMVELHGGSIEAYSEGKGKGATFTVRLPLLPAEAAIAATAPHLAAPAAKPAPRPLRILLVEDHGDTARIMHRLLSANGHEVHNAADVATALKLAGAQGFDLLLSDLGLPDGSGLDLMRSLRQQALTLPGIALSGYGQEQDLKASREAGFAAHLTKPVDIQRLEELIAEIVGTSS